MTFPDPSQAPTPGQLPLSKVLALVTDTFTSATERHIEVGDGLEVFIVLTLPTTGTDSWEEASGGLLKGGEGLDAGGVSVEVLESLGTVGGRETRCLIVRKELKKD
jgi:20S proteasome subunit beta 6